MLLAVVLILSGLGLILFGARVFFGVLFLSAGVYLIVSLLKIKLISQKRKARQLSFLVEQLKGKLSEDDLNWIEDFFTPPVGRKFVVWVQERRENTTVRISIPISLILLLKPFLGSLLPIVLRFLGKKLNLTLSREELDSIVKLLNSSFDELLSYQGDFVYVETETATVKIGLV